MVPKNGLQHFVFVSMYLNLRLLILLCIFKDLEVKKKIELYNIESQHQNIVAHWSIYFLKW